MATVKEIKEKLDAAGVDYPSKAKKAESLWALQQVETGGGDTPADEDRPRNIKGDRPDYVAAGDDFIDPNADPATQAD